MPLLSIKPHTRPTYVKKDVFLTHSAWVWGGLASYWVTLVKEKFYLGLAKIRWPWRLFHLSLTHNFLLFLPPWSLSSSPLFPLLLLSLFFFSNLPLSSIFPPILPFLIHLPFPCPHFYPPPNTGPQAAAQWVLHLPFCVRQRWSWKTWYVQNSKKPQTQETPREWKG